MSLRRPALCLALAAVAAAPAATARPSHAERATALLRRALIDRARTASPFVSLFAETRAVRKGHQIAIAGTRVRGSAAELSIFLVKSSAMSAQGHEYDFNRAGFTCTAKLRRCTLNAARRLGDYGRVVLTFVPKGPARRMNVMPCTGSIRERRGTLVGSFRFNAHAKGIPTYRGRFKAQAALDAGSVDCPDVTSDPLCHVTDLEGAMGDTGYASVIQDSEVNATFAAFSVPDPAPRPPATISHLLLAIDQTGTAFTASPDLSSATVNGAVLPQVSGTLRYAAKTPPAPATDGCPGQLSTTGQVSGDLTLHLDGTPPIAVAPPVTTVSLTRAP